MRNESEKLVTKDINVSKVRYLDVKDTILNPQLIQCNVTILLLKLYRLIHKKNGPDKNENKRNTGLQNAKNLPLTLTPF